MQGTLTPLSDFADALSPHIQGELRTDTMTRALYATDASLYQMMPLAVLVPRHIEDVHAAVEAAQRYGIPVLPRGGGSSLAGQTVGTALVIDFSNHLNAILEINPEERWARVMPGLVLDTLSSALQPHGLMVGPDPASSNRATLGGMVANNSTGTHSILYGNVINHIHSVKALLADGSAVHFGPVDPSGWAERSRRSGLEGDIYRGLTRLVEERGAIIERDTSKHWRRNTGYRLEYLLRDERNLAHLLCGSEGTLGVITELTIGLVPQPKRTALAVAQFHTRRDALRSVTSILETEPSAIELFDENAIQQTRLAPGYAHRLTFLEGNPGAILVVEYYGETDAELRDKAERLRQKMLREGHGYAIVPAITPQQMANVWTIRKEGLGLIMSVKGDAKPQAFIEDAAVPVEHLADYIEELEEAVERLGTRMVLYAHASAGCLHVRPFINTKDARDVIRMRDIAQASMELVRKYGGVVSSEHGEGLARSWLNEQLLGPELYETNRQLKRLFDPKGILNPGKKVDAPPMTENLRMGPDYQVIPTIEVMDFSEHGGFQQAIELCNGNGACRKLQNGTMCPSYMVTYDEEDTTRARANALRAAMSGEIPHEELTGQRMYDVMDLCVMCKACKTECPSNVDMAKIKTEWLRKYWEANGLPQRTRFFAYMPFIVRKLSNTPLAKAGNWFNGLKLTRKAFERTLGVSTKRELPPVAPESFTAWFKKRQWRTDGTPVVLFADTFYNYNHPEVAQAAAEFLDRTGFRVIVQDERACCGRTLLSKGLVTEAQQLALKTLELLYPYVEQGLPIIGLEPSCILTFRDEFLALLPGEPRARLLAQQALTFEEFVVQQQAAGAFAGVQWKKEPRSVLVHGHCHQKALVGITPSEQCLSIPGYTVATVDSGCCGMAGSFGYEKEHYEISIAMAERRLAPAVRSSAPDTIIAAAGTSCRSQIKDTTGRQALHPAEILRNALV